MCELCRKCAVLDPVSHRPLIKPKGGFGGLGGAIIKPVALANARKFYELLGDTIQIVGCGGIVTGVDAYEYSLVVRVPSRLEQSMIEKGIVYFKSEERGRGICSLSVMEFDRRKSGKTRGSII